MGHFARLAPYLAEHRRVYAIDLLGFGASDKPSDIPYGPELWAELVCGAFSYFLPYGSSSLEHVSDHFIPYGLGHSLNYCRIQADIWFIITLCVYILQIESSFHFFVCLQISQRSSLVKVVCCLAIR